MGEFEERLMKERSTHLRRTAFCAVALSTVAVAACLVTFPTIFQYVQSLQAEITNDIDWCKSRSRDMWKEMVNVEQGEQEDRMEPQQLARALSIIKASDSSFEPRHYMEKRQSGAAPMICCTCHRGPAGPPGADGRDGRDGAAGARGAPGNPGSPAPEAIPPSTFAPQCPCEADEGSQGPSGDKGPNGNPGNGGAPGNQGPNGNQGPPGPPGSRGNDGPPGPRGSPGTPGAQSEEVGPQGQPGNSGRSGNAGPPGQPGSRGQDGGPGPQGAPGSGGNAGRPGSPGGQGNSGGPGPDGPEGSCDHCPPARLAPGY